jgi:LysR family nitrogen assimilation transcriptional regulator
MDSGAVDRYDLRLTILSPPVPQKEHTMELKQLRYFVRIVDLGSFSRAAGDIHVVQSALSEQIASLESELGAELLVRTARGVTPTRAGEIFYRRAHEILRQADDVRQAVTSLTDAPTGSVSFGVPLSLIHPLGLALLETVTQRYPHIQLTIHEGVNGAILEWIKNGRMSLGLAFEDGANLAGLMVTPVMEERMYLVMKRGSPLARRKSVSLAELQEMPLLMPSRAEGVRPRLERAMVRHGFSLQCAPGEINSFNLLKLGAANAVAPTVLTWPGIAHEVATGTLAAVEIVRPTVTRTCVLCVLPTATENRAANAVASVALEILRGLAQHSRWRGVRYLGPEDGALWTDSASHEGSSS